MLKPLRRVTVLSTCLAMLPAQTVSAGQPAPVPPPVVQTSADCARPQYASDMLVCGDAELSAIDAEVAGLAAGQPSLAEGAIWEDQAAWFRRRSLCAFHADHRGCLMAAYADRRLVWKAVAAAVTQPLRCTGAWQGRSLATSAIVAGQPVAIRENAVLIGVATLANPEWQPGLGWRPAGAAIKLKTLDGRQFGCRPAP